MSDVKVVEKHNTSPDDAMSRIAEFEEMMKKFGVKANWKGQKAELAGTGVKGSIVVDDENVTVEIALGMLARAAGIDSKRLTESIRKRLQKSFAD